MTLIKKFFLAFPFLCFPVLSWAQAVTVTVKIEPGISNDLKYNYEILKINKPNETRFNACHMSDRMDPESTSPTPHDHTSVLGGTKGPVEPHNIGTIADLKLDANDDICVLAWRSYSCGGRGGCDGDNVSYVTSAIVKVHDVLNTEDHTIVVSGHKEDQLSYLSFARPPSIPPSSYYTVDLSFPETEKRIIIYQPFQNMECYGGSPNFPKGGIIANKKAHGVTENVSLFLGQNYESVHDGNRYFCFQIIDGRAGLQHETHGPYIIGPKTPHGKFGTIKITTTRSSCFQETNSDDCDIKIYKP
jgi:hypothetical protein